MSNFLKEGDIAIAQYFNVFPERNGEECTILNSLQFTGIINDDMTTQENVLRYRVEFSDGFVCGPLPHQLRKRPEPDINHGDSANDDMYEDDRLAA